MNASDDDYNLLYEPWIMVVRDDGSPGAVGLLDLFKDAPKIHDVVGDCPQQSVTILRLALAILHCAYRGDFTEKELDDMWLDIWKQGHFDWDVVGGYLEKREKRFCLFGDRPFMQVAGLEFGSGKDASPVSELIADVPKPDKFLFSLRNRDSGGMAAIGFAEAARWLLFAQSFDIAGIKTPVSGNTHVNKGKAYAPKGKCGTGLLGGMQVTSLWGANFFETLMLNWVLYDTSRAMQPACEDQPPWEREEGSLGPDMVERRPCGPVDMLTWQSRRMRLVREGDRVTGVISCYGDVTALDDLQSVESMCSWRESEDRQKRLGTAHVPWMPVQPRSDRSIWRGLASLLAVENEQADLRPGVIRWAERMNNRLAEEDMGKRLFRIRAQGMTYGTQNAVFEDSIDDGIDLAAVLLRHDSPAVFAAIEIVNQAESAVSSLARLARELEERAGGRGVVADDVRRQAYSALDSIFRERLAGFDAETCIEEFCDEWRGEIHRILLTLADGLIARTGARQFSGSGDGSIAAVGDTFRKNLNKELGFLSVGSQGSQREGEEQ